MATPRPRKTLADYLVIAICPLLIMALVGSVAFFLLDLIYHGQWIDRLRWALGWFVLASVLISRISIEQGSEYARIYGILLALATAALIYRLVGIAVAGWCLLAFIWWCTSKLTWDCTLVDDWEDASGEGLLQVGGLEQTEREPASQPDDKKKKSKRPTWWDRLSKNSFERKGQPHAPGIWVVYFSLLALPTFGIGQAFFGQHGVTTSEAGFKLLWFYVAAALGLLLATSFLGLRRYLRQRNLQMPISVAGLWILLGTLLAGGIMLLTLLLPRPDAKYTLASAVEEVSEAAKKQASKYAALSGTSAEGEGRRIGSGDGQTNDQEREKGKSDGLGKDPNKKAASGQSGESEAAKAGPGDGEKLGKTGGANPDGQDAQSKSKSSPEPPKPDAGRNLNWVGELVKWLIYGLIFAGIAVFAYRHRRELLKGLKQLLTALKEMLASLMFWRRTPEEEVAHFKTFADTNRPEPFSSFANPFKTGQAQNASPEQIISYTFQALQAWANDRQCPRLSDQTPLEFARDLAARAPFIGDDAHAIAQLYTRIAYAGFHPTEESLVYVEQLWSEMESATAKSVKPLAMA